MSNAAGFLPVCIHNNRLLFLFGLESPAETTAKGWSDFAGGMEKFENNNDERDVYNAGLREMAEETSGFFGGPNEINKLVKKNGGYLKYTHKNEDSDYHIHLFRLDYDEKLIDYYNSNHKYLYDNLSHKLLESTKVFEKIQIKWFSVQDMKKHRNKFRHFYRDVIDYLIGEVPQITNFIINTHRKQKK
jgi:hypothetical protein